MQLTKGDEIRAKEILSEYADERHLYESARLALEETETAILHITVDYEKTKVKSSPKPDKYADIIDKLIKQRREFIQAADNHADAMERVYRTIGKVKKGINRDVLTRYYIAGQTWDEIASDLGYSWSGIYKVYKRALFDFYQNNQELF